MFNLQNVTIGRLMYFMKYFFTILLSVIFFGKAEASLQSKEIKKLYEEGFELINKDMAKADSLISLAWKKSVKVGDANRIADGYFYKGCLLDRQMKVDSAIIYFNKANTFYHLADDWENVPDTYGRLGLLLIKKNERQEGLRHLLEALKLAEELKNPKAFIRNTIVLAMHHNDYTGQYDEAVKYLKQAEKSAKDLGDRALLGHVYLQLSISYCNKKDYPEAIKTSQQSLHEFTLIESTYNQMRALFTLANVYKASNQTDKIIEVLTRVEPLLEENSDDLMKANYYKLLAETLYQKGQFKEALTFAEKATRILKAGGENLSANNLEDLLFRIHYLLGNRETADSLYNQFNASRDSMFSMKSFSVDAEMRQKYSTEKRIQQIEFQELELKNARYLRQGLLGILVFSVLLCVLIYGRLREKARNERILALKNEKIERQYVSLRQMNEYNETLLREIHHRVKNNLQIISSLFSIQARNIQHPDVINLIEKSKSRLKTISIIHNTLYSQKSLSKIKISDFVKEIGESLFEIYNIENTLIQSLHFDIKGDSIYLNADTSLPIGLVVNELITNSLKYAFVESSIIACTKNSFNQEYSTVLEDENLFHRISISINKVSSNEFALTYTDSGAGLHDDIDIQTSKTTGLRLIRGLLQQLNGSIDYKKDSSSHQFLVLFREVD